MEANNYTCNHFSRAYLRHLIMANEMLAATLLSIHNVHFFLDLMEQARYTLLKAILINGAKHGLSGTIMNLNPQRLSNEMV